MVPTVKPLLWASVTPLTCRRQLWYQQNWTRANVYKAHTSNMALIRINTAYLRNLFTMPWQLKLSIICGYFKSAQAVGQTFQGWGDLLDSLLILVSMYISAHLMNGTAQFKLDIYMRVTHNLLDKFLMLLGVTHVQIIKIYIYMCVTLESLDKFIMSLTSCTQGVNKFVLLFVNCTWAHDLMHWWSVLFTRNLLHYVLMHAW